MDCVWNGTVVRLLSKSSLRNFIIVGVGCGLAGCEHSANATKAAVTKPSDSQAASPIIKVIPITPVRKTLIRMVEQPGHVEAFQEAPLFAKVTGYIKTLNVDIGDAVTGPKLDENGHQVSAGQVLCELDVPELHDEFAQKKALVEQARASVIQGRAAIDVAVAALESSQSKVAELEAQAQRDKANYDRWKSESDRITELAKSGSVGKKVADETLNQLRTVEADQRQTVAKMKSARVAIQEAMALVEKIKADYRALEAKCDVAVAEANKAKHMLEYTHIQAPFDGRISARNIHVGHLARASASDRDQPLLIVARVDRVRVVVDVPEADAVLIHDGCDATVRIPSLIGTGYTGKVSRLGWALHPGTRTLRVEIDVENPDGTLREGMYVTAEVKAAVHENALSLPRSAVLLQDKNTFCHTIDADGKVQLVPIQLGIQSGTDVEIQKGLEGNEQVIGSNTAAFKPGQTVEIAVPPKS